MSAIALPAGYAISSDPALLNLEVIHGFISQSYWAKGIPPALIERMIGNSLCFGIYHQTAQVGFGRIITDRATFAYLAAGFVLPDHRAPGLSTARVQPIRAHPDVR